MITFRGFCLALIMSLLTSIITYAQDVVSIPFQAEQGQTFIVKIKKQRIDTKNKDVTNDVTTQFAYEGKIEEADDDELTIVWTFQNMDVHVNKQSKKSSDIDTGILFEFAKKPIRFKTDSFGNPIKLENYDELKDAFRKALANSKDGEKTIRYFEQTFFAFDDKTAAHVFLPEASLIGQGQSLSIPANETVEETTQVPNPLGGPPFNFKISYKLVENTDTLVEIESIGTSDPESVRTSMQKTIERILQQSQTSNEKAHNELKDLKITRSDRVRYTIEKESGWTQKVTLERRIESSTTKETNERDENWIIEVLKN